MDSPHAKTFYMACPKCGSRTTYSVTRITGTSGAGGGTRDDWSCRVFSCTCGKQLYGLPIKEEYDLQQLAFMQVENEKVAEEARANVRLMAKEKAQAAKEKAQAAKSKAEAKVKAEAEAEALRRGEEERKRQLQQSGICTWKSCENKTREASLYCSRDCSNKNARWRHAQRKKSVATQND